MLRRLFLIVPLLLVTLLLFALVDWNPAEQESAVNQEARQVDFFAINVRRVQFQADGSLHSELESPKIEHLLGSEVSLLEQPYLRIYQKDSTQPWQIKSQSAEVSPDGKKVELKDNVRIRRRDEKSRDILIRSTQITLFPEESYATTDEPVRIETTEGIASGIGMQAWLKERKLKLLSTARGQYEAP